METVAANPGRVNPKFNVWLRYYKRGTVIFALIAVGICALMATISFWFVALLPFVGLVFAIHWQAIQQHFMRGNSSPGFVLQERPLRVATATDLSTDDTPYPVLKIVDYGFHLKGPAAPKAGDIIATMSLYATDGTPTPRHWIDFEPIPVHCATDDPAVIGAAGSNLSKEALDFLNLLKSRSPSLNPGLYWFDGQTMQPIPAPPRKR